MKSRLDALLRQRELLREHAQWLDDEIAAERTRMGGSAATVVPPVATAPTPLPSSTSSTATPIALPVEADVKGLHNEVRRGCLLYFLLAIAILVGLIAFIYWKYESDSEATPSPAPRERPTSP